MWKVGYIRNKELNVEYGRSHKRKKIETNKIKITVILVEQNVKKEESDTSYLLVSGRVNYRGPSRILWNMRVSGSYFWD